MDIMAAVEQTSAFWSPGAFSFLVGVAVLLAWMAFQPAPPIRPCRTAWTTSWNGLTSSSRKT